MSQIWLVSVPNNKETPERTIQSLQNDLGANKLFRVEIPNLVVGTLDTLMSLADELGKIGTQVENVVRKVERQFFEVSGTQAEPLRVNETAVEAYLRRFQWDFAQYQYQGRQLQELVGQMQSMTGKIDEDLKTLTTAYTDKCLALASTKRKKIVNLSTSDLEDFLSPLDIDKIEALNTEHLLTVLVVVPKSLETEFLSNYSTLGSNIAAYGGPDWSSSYDNNKNNNSKNTSAAGNNNITAMQLGADDGKFGPGVIGMRCAVTGSPVVPGSAKKVVEEGELVMYAITLLKGHYQAGTLIDEVFAPGQFVDYIEPMKSVLREKRFIMRELVYNDSLAGGVDALIQQSETEVNQIRNTLLRWCKAHFGEAYSAWTHIKMIQAFVESVLRYGLPVDFATFFLEPSYLHGKGGGGEKEVRQKLTNAVVNLRPELKMKRVLVDAEDEDGDGDGDDSNDNLPYVCFKISVLGSSSSNNNT